MYVRKVALFAGRMCRQQAVTTVKLETNRYIDTHMHKQKRLVIWLNTTAVELYIVC